jgi:hypothetical protein
VAFGARHPAGTSVPRYFQQIGCALAVRTIGPRARQLPMLVTMLGATLHHLLIMRENAPMDNTPARPTRDETVEYYHPYIDLVPDGDICQILDQQRLETLSFLKTIPEAMATHRYAPEKWSVGEVLGHLNDSERLYTMRAFWFSRAMESPLPSFESDAAVKIAKHADRAWSTLVHEFASIRASTVDLFRNLPPEAWSRRGVASDYPFSVRALAYIAAGHVIHHVRILKERYL